MAGGPDPPPGKYKNIGVLLISGPDPLEITKLPGQQLM